MAGPDHGGERKQFSLPLPPIGMENKFYVYMAWHSVTGEPVYVRDAATGSPRIITSHERNGTIIQRWRPILMSMGRSIL